jgi:hypothetical protein
MFLEFHQKICTSEYFTKVPVLAFVYGRPGIGLVHKCVMVNKAHTRFKLSLDEPDAGSRLTSLSFKIRYSSHSAVATDYEESEPTIMMFSGDYISATISVAFAHLHRSLARLSLSCKPYLC